jgi:hypothetical protein
MGQRFDSGFDELSRELAETTSRRAALRLLAAGTAGGLLSLVGMRGAGARDCEGIGDRCRRNNQCCSGACRNGRCCRPDGGRCRRNNQCCSGTCTNGTCGAPTGCAPGETLCAPGTDCESCCPESTFCCSDVDPFGNCTRQCCPAARPACCTSPTDRVFVVCCATDEVCSPCANGAVTCCPAGETCVECPGGTLRCCPPNQTCDFVGGTNVCVAA